MKSVYDIGGMQREAFLLTAKNVFDIATRGLYRLKESQKTHLRPFKKMVAQLKTV